MQSLICVVFAFGAVGVFFDAAVLAYDPRPYHPVSFEEHDDAKTVYPPLWSDLATTTSTAPPSQYETTSYQSTTEGYPDVTETTSAQKDLQTRQCSDNLKNLWLDIVFVLDSSVGVNRHDFNFQKAMIIGLLNEIDVSQDLGRFSRIAFVNAGRKAHRISNLTTYADNEKARNDLMSIPFLGDRRINVGAGLIEAQRILDESDERANVRNLIVLFSSKNVDCEKKTFGRLLDEHPCRIATTIQERGAILMTVAMNFHETADSGLLRLGTPCYATSNNIHFRDDFHRIALQANCFCHAPYKQFIDEQSCQGFGECLYLAESPTVYPAAQLGCQMDDAALADVFSVEKANFLEHMATENEQTPFWIGLNDRKRRGEIEWESGSEFSFADFHKFSNNSAISGQFCTAALTVGAADDEFQWSAQDCSYSGPTNYYFCQRAACDADNYCL